MFSFFNKQVGNFDVILGPDSKIIGDIESDGSVRLDGNLNGSVKSKGEVIVTEKSEIEGNIVCLSANIFGKCTGNIETYGTVNLHADSIMKGDIKAESFKTEKGCEFIGNCEITPRKSNESEKLIKLNDRQKENIKEPAKSNSKENNKSSNSK